MDQTTFRQLLSRHIGDLIDPKTLLKGADYIRRGRVLETRYAAGDREGALVASVQGTESDPYASGIRIRVGERVRLDSYCTCPMEAACKHVAATALHELRGTRLASGALVPDNKPQLGAWKSWLDALHAPAAQRAAPAAAEAAETVCGIILSEGEGVLPSLLAQVVRLKRGKRGGFVAPRPLQPSWQDPSPWQGLDPDEFRLVATLRMRAANQDEREECFRLAGSADEDLLLELLATLPCFFEKPSKGRLRAGIARALRIGWDARDDGTQKLVLSVDAASPKSVLLRVGGLWYLDPERSEIGRVDGEARLAEAVLRAPPLLPEQVPLLLERWKDAPLLATLPKPVPTGAIERRQIQPVAVLTLRAFAVVANGSRYQAGCARLSFDYGGVQLPAFPAPQRERRRVGDKVIEVVRDRASEIAALERLEGIGLFPAEMFGSLPGVARDAFDDNDFVLEHRRDQLVGAEQLFALAPRLRDLGFRLESSDGFPFDLIDEPAAEAWYAEVEEESGNPWFDLRLGIDVGGERIDLLPVLHRLLSDPNFPLRSAKGKPTMRCGWFPSMRGVASRCRWRSCAS